MFKYVKLFSNIWKQVRFPCAVCPQGPFFIQKVRSYDLCRQNLGFFVLLLKTDGFVCFYMGRALFGAYQCAKTLVIYYVLEPFGIHPVIPVIPRIPAKWRSGPLLGASLPHARWPGWRELNKLPQMNPGLPSTLKLFWGGSGRIISNVQISTFKNIYIYINKTKQTNLTISACNTSKYQN